MQWLIPMTVGATQRDSPGLYRRGSISSTYRQSIFKNESREYFCPKHK